MICFYSVLKGFVGFVVLLMADLPRGSFVQLGGT